MHLTLQDGHAAALAFSAAHPTVNVGLYRVWQQPAPVVRYAVALSLPELFDGLSAELEAVYRGGELLADYTAFGELIAA